MEQTTTLYYREGSSDKVYQARIVPQENDFIVEFAYGRRGTTLQTGTKTHAPIGFDEAKRIYDKLIAEKIAKGYTPGEDGAPHQGSERADRATGIHCQLLNPIEETHVEKLIIDPAYWMQEKYDGRRLLIRKEDEHISGINRLGFTVALPQTLISEAAACPVDMIFDGEAIGDVFYVFDALRIGDDDIGSSRYGERYLRVMNLLASFQHRSIRLAHTVFLHQQKATLFHHLKTSGAEGVVFKHSDAPYVAGRPATGGSQLKLKFCATASFVVGKINARRSIGLLLFDGDKIKAAGNVTIPANQEIPAPGWVVECRYLYAYRESGSIFQPVYLGPRDDIRAEECTTSQLKYKAEQMREVA